MTKLLLCLAAAVLQVAAFAQDVRDAPAQRARIAAARQQVETTFGAQEKACYGQFAVNDCLDDARARRRTALADLRRQEIVLNDAERRQRAAGRQRELEEIG